MKFFSFAIIIALSIVVSSTAAHAYLLPKYAISADEWAAPADKVYASRLEELAEIERQVPLNTLSDIQSNHKARVSAKARKALKSFDDAKNAADFWAYVDDLKKKLIALHGEGADSAVADEADLISKAVVERIYALSQEYRVAISALIRNLMINIGAKKNGFCYQYVNEIRKSLSTRTWDRFDIRWGEAWPKNWRENNALVITAKGAPFESGLAIDVWRSAGKPFWTPVKGDRFPWQEAVGVEIE